MLLTGPQQGILRKMIQESFTIMELQTFLLERLDIGLYVHITTPYVEVPIQVGAVISYYNNKGWIPKLISSLIADRPAVRKFQELAFEWDVGPALYEVSPVNMIKTGGLEALVNSDPMLDIDSFIQGLTDYKRCVCRIKVVDGKGAIRYGTGFLVGEDLLLTNYHVLQPVIENPGLAMQVVCKFDYEVSGEMLEISPGNDYALNKRKPVEASSPPCPFDRDGTLSVEVDWPEGHFDYALARLSEKIGTMPFGPNAARSSSSFSKRGWIKKSPNPVPLFQGGNILIMQHPDKQPMKLAIGLNKIIGCDENERRVRYAVNTLEGSSGSPCFDHKFNWIALHNMGDPNYNAKYNQGIPSERIIEDLKTKNIHL
jgi:hypothetical protein